MECWWNFCHLWGLDLSSENQKDRRRIRGCVGTWYYWPSVCVSVCGSIHVSETLFVVDPITHWTVWLWPSIMVSTVSWDDEVAHKTCCFDLDIFLIFLQGHENLEYFVHYIMNGGHFVDPIAHWTVSLWPSIMVSTVSRDDEVAHKTRCFDLYPFLTILQDPKNLLIFPYCTMVSLWTP